MNLPPLPESKPCCASQRRPAPAAGALSCLALGLAVAVAPAPAQRLKPGAATKAAPTPAAPVYGASPAVRRFTDELAERRGLDRAWVLRHLAQARRIASVQRLVMPPPAGTAKNWAAYRSRFVEPRRIAAGAAFWQAHEAWLQRAEARYGVPAQIVVGVIGVETYYGRITGGYRVIDALATLAFDFPTGRRDRSGFFRAELEEFLVLCQRQGLDPLGQNGSFAGAMGLGQFMPGSINRHAVDFDGDGRIDMAHSAADVIGSIAAYLAESGWQRGLPTHFDVDVPVDSRDRATLLGPDILPGFTPAQFVEHGARLPAAALSHPGRLALVELQNGDQAPSYVAGTQNFHAVTRYNRSSYYALAVIDLGVAVAAARQGPPPADGASQNAYR